jgi:hypothetical protein
MPNSWQNSEPEPVENPGLEMAKIGHLEMSTRQEILVIFVYYLHSIDIE